MTGNEIQQDDQQDQQRDDQGDGEAPARRGTARRPGGRRPALGTIALGVSVVLGTALLLWGADWLARWGAESLLARNVQQATGAPERPSVHVRGTFFLPQLIRGRYGDVEITVHDLSSGPLHIEEVHAQLTGVHLPFHDVLVRNSGPVFIEGTVEEAFLSYDSLNHYLDVTGRPVTIGAGSQDGVRLTGTVEILGRSISAATQARLLPREGALAVQPTQLDTDTILDPASRLLLGQRFTFLVPLDPLPFGQRLTAVEPRGSGLLVRAQGTDVVIRR
ncbi:Protein of unknown function [Modestobacter sp. DSM 44400]|uniref:LmeA family phospholipid-binding protein n=1 Tax=Modestobacter sp. DSM 44400 TaxID=1550230 RepID=UPI00089C2F99|nr:DUF2993 domain-containing protein [Modestobacter sp. DSM 44400]SDX90484.1 Protein of unknown function [Modestobacter sp. DSM 44400]